VKGRGVSAVFEGTDGVVAVLSSTEPNSAIVSRLVP
jgi:hypothetical protein